MSLSFESLNNDTSCNCLDGAYPDDQSSFALKTNKPLLRDVDFSSKWDKGERPETDDCKVICSKKGVSLSLLNTDNVNEVNSIYQKLFPIAPKYKPYITTIKLAATSGLVKHTPSRNNAYHFDFYKSDSFEISQIKLIETKNL